MVIDLVKVNLLGMAENNGVGNKFILFNILEGQVLLIVTRNILIRFTWETLSQIKYRTNKSIARQSRERGVYQ